MQIPCETSLLVVFHEPYSRAIVQASKGGVALLVASFIRDFKKRTVFHASKTCFYLFIYF